MIPILDLKAQYAAIEQEIDAAIKEVLLSGQFILGPAAFHCQQAFLVWRSVTFEKVHSLVYLMALCEEPGFASLREEAESLWSKG